MSNIVMPDTRQLGYYVAGAAGVSLLLLAVAGRGAVRLASTLPAAQGGGAGAVATITAVLLSAVIGVLGFTIASGGRAGRGGWRPRALAAATVLWFGVGVTAFSLLVARLGHDAAAANLSLSTLLWATVLATGALLVAGYRRHS